MRLPAVLTRLETPVAELSALRLDGEAFALDESVIAVDEPIGPAQRARALAALVDPRLVAELDTALWVHGCRTEAPLVHTLAIPRGRRGRFAPVLRLAVRETSVAAADTVLLGGVRVTDPARTLYDLALLPEVAAERRAGAAALCAAHPEAASAASSMLRAADHLPHKHRALARIAQWGA